MWKISSRSKNGVTLIVVLKVTLFFLCGLITAVMYMLVKSTNLEVEPADVGGRTSATTTDFPYKGIFLPFHQVYEARKVGMHQYRARRTAPSNSSKIILLWTPWNGVVNTINYYFLRPGNTSFTICPNTRCLATQNRSMIQQADAVLFYLLDVKLSDMPRNRRPSQLWILYNMEPPWLVRRKKLGLSKMKNLFNLTMSYREDSDIPARYGFIEFSPTMVRNHGGLFEQKTRSVVWFVSDCKTDSKREDYVKELGKHIDIDIYGQCGSKKCYPAQSDFCYTKVLEKYKFYLSFENALCRDYVTEKFFNVFNYPIMPVVFGMANYTRIAPYRSFIDATTMKPSDLASELRRLGSNQQLYEKLLNDKSRWTSFLDPWTCRLCDRVHDSVSTSSVSDISKWWIADAKCIAWHKESK